MDPATRTGSKSDVQHASPQTIPAKMFHARFGASSSCQRSYSAVSPIAIRKRMSDWCRERPNAVAQTSDGRTADPAISSARPNNVNSRERINTQKATSTIHRAGETSAPAQSSGCFVKSQSGK